MRGMLSRGMGMLELFYLSNEWILNLQAAGWSRSPGPQNSPKKFGPPKKMVHQDQSRVERFGPYPTEQVLENFVGSQQGVHRSQKGVLDMLDVDNMEEYGTTWKHISLKETSGSSWISCITTVGKCIPTHSYICICWIEEFSHEFANWSTYDTDIIVPDTYIMYTYCA